jgi:hypothetical protein
MPISPRPPRGRREFRPGKGRHYGAGNLAAGYAAGLLGVGIGGSKDPPASMTPCRRCLQLQTPLLFEAGEDSQFLAVYGSRQRTLPPTTARASRRA